MVMSARRLDAAYAAMYERYRTGLRRIISTHDEFRADIGGLLAGKFPSLMNGHSTMFASRLVYPQKRTFDGSHLMSALGQQQTSARVRITSASPPKADIRPGGSDVRLGPDSD
jgi:hypothetical protein